MEVDFCPGQALSEKRRRKADLEAGYIRVTFPKRDGGGEGYDAYLPEDFANQLGLPFAQSAPAPSSSLPTFNAHWEWWRENFLGELQSRKDFEQRVRDYLVPTIGRMTEPEMTPDALRAVFRGIKAKVGAQTYNHVRAHGHKIVADLVEEGRWGRNTPNPFARVPKLEVVPRDPYMPSSAELERFIRVLLFKNQPLAALAIGFPSRIGELRSIPAAEVDLTNKRLSIRRSGNAERNATKNGSTRANVPYPDWLHPFLEQAVALAKAKGSEWLISNPKGKQLSKNYKGASLVRRAFVRAGVVAAADLTFHDLRHVAITRLQEAGCHPGVVGLVAGHGKKPRSSTTQRVYTHFSEDFIRSEINKFSLQVRPKPGPGSGTGSRKGICSPQVRGTTVDPISASSSVWIEQRPSKPLPFSPSQLESPFPIASGLLDAVGERFFQKVDKSRPCWLWQGAADGEGYGSFRVAGRKLTAHRVSMELVGRLLAPDQVIRHSDKCVSRRCVNPDHLTIGTHAENRADCVRLGRQAKGSKNGRAKLTENAVRAIRVLWRTLGVAELARRYGVSQRAIRFAAEGRNWKHINSPQRGKR